MGVREKLNQNPSVAIGLVGVVIVFAAVLVFLQLRSTGAAPAAGNVGKVFFTNDDGKTWFIDDAKNIPPFQKDGKEVVRAYVYRTGDGTEFVGFLERYSPEGKQILDKALSLPAEQQQFEDPFLTVSAMVQWKKPGAAGWVSVSDPRADQIAKVVSPKGVGDPVTPVAPGQ